MHRGTAFKFKIHQSHKSPFAGICERKSGCVDLNELLQTMRNNDNGDDDVRPLSINDCEWVALPKVLRQPKNERKKKPNVREKTHKHFYERNIVQANTHTHRNLLYIHFVWFCFMPLALLWRKKKLVPNIFTQLPSLFEWFMCVCFC